jgi:hypothetical protein
MPNLEKEAADYQRELFQLFSEFFGRATGIPPREFATIDSFGDEIRKRASTIAYRGEDAFTWADTELRRFYAEKGASVFRIASRLGGLKLVLGGSSRFLSSQFSAVSGSLLYADTILIPDPVAPWMEKERREEKFRHVLMLQAAHALLHLKPIVDADLPHCPVLVFPSWEKLLEENDPVTINRMLELLVDFFGEYVDPAIATADDAAEFVRTHPEQFFQAIERNKLSVAPGGPIGESVLDALARYESNLETWRSNEWLDDFRKRTPAGKVMNGVLERLQPQYHLLENSEELKANPLICIEQQAHYFRLLSELNSGRLERVGLLDTKTKAMISGLASERLGWLSGVPVDALIEVRKNNENDVFRKLLANAIGNLHDAALEDTDRVAAEICREIDSGIAEHNRLVEQIGSKYADKMFKWVGAVAVTGIAALVPSLAPYLGVALPLALAGKLGWDAWDLSAERKRQSRSLMGVLAVARSEDQQE